MLFQSIEFFIFLPTVFLTYWFLFRNNLKFQNLFILAASYFFYGWWDWRFLSLIVISSLVDFFLSQKIHFFNSENKKNTAKNLLIISLMLNLGLLMIFKYFNFFIDSFQDFMSMFGIQTNVGSLDIILPVGISFYTFQTLSYSIDVYRNRMKPTRDLVAFFSFVGFFPQLVAGPIERATNLLPQFQRIRKFSYSDARCGLQQILAGFFKKLVIADSCAVYANRIFAQSDELHGSILLLGVIYFAFQIYGDFSGYSDIAIGLSKLFGIQLMDNFKTPYFSRDIAEFWRRWHISLSTWFRDYLYIPLGGSRGGRLQKIKNTFIIFIVSGLWHGANWTFIVWGLLNALYFLPLLMSNKNRTHLDIVAQSRVLPSFKEFIQMSTTFLLTCLAWVFFRAESLEHAATYFSNMFSISLFYFPTESRGFLPVLLLFIIAEWAQRKKKNLMDFDENISVTIRWFIYLLTIFLIIYFSGEKQDFIYFQF